MEKKPMILGLMWDYGSTHELLESLKDYMDCFSVVYAPKIDINFIEVNNGKSEFNPNMLCKYLESNDGEKCVAMVAGPLFEPLAIYMAAYSRSHNLNIPVLILDGQGVDDILTYTTGSELESQIRNLL